LFDFRAPLGALAIASGVALAGCPKTDGPERAEAGRVSRAIDALRDAGNREKPRLLEALRREPCSYDDVCAVRSKCIAAYELHTNSLESIAEALKLVDAGDATIVAPKVTQARNGLERARKLAEDCTRAQGELVRNRRL
jgi:hypothetical protein